MIIALVIVAVVFISIVVYLLTSGRSTGGTGSAAADFGKRPAVSDFHVRDDTALVLFDVVIPGQIDDHIAKVLTAQAIEVVREKKGHLPIAQVTTVVAQARRNGGSVEVGRVALETPGELPPPLPIPEAPRASAVANDPLATFTESLSTSAPATAPKSREAELGPAGVDLVLPNSTIQALAERGYEPLAVTAGELATELLEMAGYTLQAGAKPKTYLAARGGSTTYLQVVDLGDYPEIETHQINGFVVDFLASRADRGLLVSDRYGPFEVYDREKREPRVRFVTRERLQGFVDALTVG